MKLLLRPTEDSYPSLSNEDQSAWIAVAEEALRIHIEKEQQRHALWKQASAADQLNMIKIKVERALHSFSFDNSAEVVVAEVPDIINYAIFAQRIVQGKI